MSTAPVIYFSKARVTRAFFLNKSWQLADNLLSNAEYAQ